MSKQEKESENLYKILNIVEKIPDNQDKDLK